MNFIYLKSSRIVEVIDKRQVLEIYRFYDEHGLEISDSEMVGARESALFNTIFCEYGVKEIDKQSVILYFISEKGSITPLIEPMARDLAQSSLKNSQGQQNITIIQTIAKL